MRNRGKRKNSKVKEVILSYFKNNIREYAIIIAIFLIGLVCGVIFINNANENQINEISTYINEFVNNLKTNIQINKTELLRDAIISNLILAVTLWFVGSTVIGIPIVYAMIAYRGFCLGYTISSTLATLGTRWRNTFYCYFYITTEYFIYSVYTITCCKWNETI